MPSFQLLTSLFVAMLVLKPFSVIANDFGVSDNTDSLYQYVQRVLSVSDEAMAIEDSVTLTQLELENSNIDYEMQIYPSLSLRNTPQGQLQSAGVVGIKQFEFGTKLKLASSYEQFESNVTTNVTRSPSLAMTVEQDLFRNFGFEAGRHKLNVAELNNKIQLLRVKQRKQQLLEQAIQTYFQYYLAQKTIEISEQAIKKAKQTFEITQSRFNMGLVSKLDLYRAEREQLTLQNQLRQRQRQLSDIKEQLVLFAKLSPNYNFKDINIQLFKAKFDTQTLEQSLLSRPDWQIQLLSEQLRKLELEDAKRSLKPDLKLVIGAKKYYDLFENEFGQTNDEIDWNIGLNYNSNFDMSREQNNYLRKKIIYNQLKRDKITIKQKILSEIQRSIDDVAYFRDVSQVNESIIEQAEMAVELAGIRFQKGLSSNLELVEAETQLQKNQLQQLENKIQFNLSLVRLAKQIGKLNLTWLKQSAVENHG